MTKKIGEILFLYITQPEEIPETKLFFERILLFLDGFYGCKIFISMATFPIWMIFFFSKKSSRPYFVEKYFLLSATPETILLGPSSKTKESLKYWFSIYKQWRYCFETLLHLTVCSPKKFNSYGISIEFHETFWCHQISFLVSQEMDG